MECQCDFKSILTGKEAESIKSLFESVGKKSPEGKMIGVIDDTKTKGLSDCPSKYSWGFNYYCDNQDFVKQYITQHRDKFPELPG